MCLLLVLGFNFKFSKCVCVCDVNVERFVCIYYGYNVSMQCALKWNDILSNLMYEATV